MDYDTAKYKTVEVTERLEIPTLDDVSNGPEIVGALVYATGNGISAEGVYRYDGSSYNQIGGAVALSDSGTDTDGGDDYQLPNAADNLNLQSDGEIHNAQSVSTDDADVIGVTVVDASRESTSNSNSAGTYVNIIDTENDDNLGELNTSQQFSPNVSGEYFVSANAFVNGGVGGDQLQIRVRNVTDGSTVAFRNFAADSSGGGANPSIIGPLTFDSGKNYEFQVTNNDSSFDIIAGIDRNYVKVLKEVVHV